MSVAGGELRAKRKLQLPTTGGREGVPVWVPIPQSCSLVALGLRKEWGSYWPAHTDQRPSIPALPETDCFEGCVDLFSA